LLTYIVDVRFVDYKKVVDFDSDLGYNIYIGWKEKGEATQDSSHNGQVVWITQRGHSLDKENEYHDQQNRSQQAVRDSHRCP